MRISGVVVLYNPEHEVFDNICSYLKTIEKLFVIDNSDIVNHELLIRLYECNNVEIISMNGNKGIGAALKEGLRRSVNENFDFCLTMDQDSVYPTDRFIDVCKFLTMDSVDNYGIIGLNINSTNNIEKLIDTKYWITSGNYINIKNYRLIDGFRDDLFIDYVDFNINEQFYNLNKKVAYIDNISLSHTIGNPKSIKILFFKCTCTNHSAIRYYYRFRNAAYLYKQNKKFYKEKRNMDFYRVLPKIILFEKNRIQKIKMIRKGIKDAKKGILGEFKEDN